MSPAEERDGPRRPGLRRSSASLPALRRTHPGLRVIGPARTKDALLAAVYLAVDAPDYAGLNYDALTDVLGDLGWLPPGPVHLAWVADPRLAGSVHRQVLEILSEATRESARGARPLTVHLIEPPST